MGLGRVQIEPELERLSIKPELATFYSYNPPHESNISKLSAVLDKYSSLPYDPSRVTGIAWMKFAEYASIGGGTRLRKVQYTELINILKRLALIDPQLQNDEIVSSMRPFMGNDDSASSSSEMPSLDEFGRAVAVGKRKSAVAKAYVVKGEGEFLVNGKPLHEYFHSLYDRERIVFPLSAINSEGDYNVFVKVRGGGISGQAGAIVNALGKALVIHNPLLRPLLNRLGFVKRDRRVVERKKPGKLKARKMPAWVKR